MAEDCGNKADSSPPTSVPQTVLLPMPPLPQPPPFYPLAFTQEVMAMGNGSSPFHIELPHSVPFPQVAQLIQTTSTSSAGGAGSSTAQTQVNPPAAPAAFEQLVGTVFEHLYDDLPQNQPKKYEAPRPDADTFATQQEFLDSLETIDIDSLAEDDRKCAICWKTYGEEPDPGFDNSELPIKLRCSHVFGAKCLANIFGVTADTHVKLIPLSLIDPKSKGSELGRMLDVYLGGAPGKAHVGIIVKMLEKKIGPRKGEKLFGEYWWIIMKDLMQVRGVDMSNVVLMENAVVVDMLHVRQQLEASKLAATAIPTCACPPTEPSPPTSTASNPVQTTKSSGSASKETASQAGSSSAVGTTQAPSHNNSASGVPHFTGLPSMDLPMLVPTAIPMAYLVEDAPIQGLFPTVSPEMLPEMLSFLPPHMLEQLEAAITAAENSFAELMHAQSHEAFLKQKAERKAMFEATRGRNLTALAQKLKRLYDEYLAQRPPLPDSKEFATIPAHPKPRVTRAALVLHDFNARETSVQVPAPNIAQSPGFGEEESENEEGEVDDKDKTFMIARRACTGCCMSVSDTQGWGVIESIYWRNDSNAPDDCPLCHKVLFKKPCRGFFSWQQ